MAAGSALSADAASGLERYFPFSSTYNDARITVRASDRAEVALLVQSENPHLPNPIGRDGTRRAYFLNTTTSSRDIAGLFLEFADPLTNLQVATVNLVYETTEGLGFDCFGKNPWDSNHRLATSQADIDAMVKIGWKDEGVVFCAPL